MDRYLGLGDHLEAQGKAREADQRSPDEVGEKDRISPRGRGRPSEPSRDERDKEGTAEV